QTPGRASVLRGRLFLRPHGPAEAELVAGAGRHALLKDDLDHLLAVDLAALLVFQRGEDLFRLGVDDLAGGRVGVAAVEAEGDPARLFAQADAGRLLRRHDRGVEDVHLAVGGVAHPDLLLVRREADAVAGAAVPLDGALLEALHLDAVQHFARL